MGGPTIRRRMLPLLGLAAATRPAIADTMDLALTCDTTLAPVLRKTGAAYTAATSVRIFVFPTGPGLIVPQLERDIQNDVVITRLPVIEQAMRQDLIAFFSNSRWRNRLVIAGRDRASAVDRTLAVTDPNPASAIDGPYVLGRLGLKPKRILGAVDTDEVAFLVGNGMAQAGLLYMTDVRARGLSVISPVPADVWPSEIHGACVTRLAQRPNPQRLLVFLAAAATTPLLLDGGLELQA